MIIDNKCLTAGQLADALGVKRNHIYQLRYRKVIPCYKSYSNSTRYDLEEVKVALHNYYRKERVMCISEMRAEAEFNNRKRSQRSIA
ncbi:helix-turn-helix domain-containing protein [Limibacter armeniacum]|uniref:helix-turn-helix domain-containing protein n=1 Tax=Limibacter armeniacum TaxID=466084 RepID=UPI002FE69E1F